MPDEPDSRSGLVAAEAEQDPRWRTFEQTIVEARRSFIDLSAGKLQSIIDEAVMTSRQDP